uniref:Myosin phosphatase Rho interacting protein n=1 Tax=Nothobranchius furzeri TaxID=105023 RepID=A0A8C6NN83_NOTFU
MSLKENACRKFQANIFNKSKCQNCFKPRESHLLNDEDLNQAKPTYAGWLLLAPEGTNFDNPLHRSRKWQRRFFILYEHGLLRYALDELPSTLPQGTINMNQCSDVIDGESRTGQKNSLCILTPDKEHFIRAECKEIINGWQEVLSVYPRTNKQNQKKKRKVDPPSHQEPGPAKVTVTSSSSGGSIPCLQSSIASAERVPMSRATLWQEESCWRRTTIPCSRSASCLSQLSQSQTDSSVTSHDGEKYNSSTVSTGRKVRVESGYFSLEKTKSEPSPQSVHHSQRSQIIGRFEDGQKTEHMETSSSLDPDVNSTGIQRQGRSERRYLESKHPDLLNFKKGWMTKLYDDEMWKKHWFVLTDQSLRYYKDSIAEEASQLDGEIDLSTCYDVKEIPVQRNYGFQILCKDGACTLSAMTSGIRRNWIQAIMKNVRPTVAPDVTRPRVGDCKSDDPNQSPDSSSSTPSSEPRKKGVRERRREGRSKTFDWSEFKMEQMEKPTKERAHTIDLSPHPPTVTPTVKEDAERESAKRGSPLHSTTNHPTAVCLKSEDTTDGTASHVQDEIEQRWHQVETTPLREEKQVPIVTTVGNPDRLPAHELAELLDKELGQKQKELDHLQQQNNFLKEQLEDALGREQNAREGYVLQVIYTSATPPPSSPHRVPWQHLHRLNQDLQGELESQKRKQGLAQQQICTLKRSYTEAQDVVDRHEADIQALQAKLASAMAEILASEQAVVRMRNELKLEQNRSKEQEEEYGRNEATLRTQLKESEDRLREVEASLLERSQALRHLEHQQALQRDHMKEIQRLQERLQEVTARLSATEEGQALKEERLRFEQCSIQESHERERQNLCRRLAEAEATQKEVEDRLLEAEQQVEALLRGRRASGGKEFKEEMLKLQEQLAYKTDIIDTLRESVRRLEDEKKHLTCRCQELLNQIAEADREVNKLRNRLETEEADYCTLEHSYERATEEFQKMSQFLKEKEEEIQQTKEMYERLMKSKEEDLKEALVKMTALGSSLEETELKLQAKEELYCQMSQSFINKAEPCKAEKDLQAKLVVAEARIAELEQHLNALHLDYVDLCIERELIPDKDKKGEVDASPPLSSNTELPLDCKDSQAKRTRIRFSSIHCQKYKSLEDMDSSHLSCPLDVEQKSHDSVDLDIQQTKENISDTPLPQTSDPEKFIGIIHELETKLLTTEEKLKNLTQNLDVQRPTKTEDSPFHDPKTSKQKPGPEEGVSGASGIKSDSSLKHYSKALVCVENSREKVKAILNSCHGSTDSQLHSLSEIENDLFNASLHIQQGQKMLDEQSPVVLRNQTLETVDRDALLLFAKTLSFEAVILNKMALLIQTSKSDLHQALFDIWEDLDHIKRSEKDCLAIVYADVLTRKLMLESAFWKDLEKAETDVAVFQKSRVSVDVDVDATEVCNTFLKAELAYSIQNLKLFYEEKFEMLKSELAEAYNKLSEREMALKAIIDASKKPELKMVIKEVKNSLGFGKQKLANIHPPELAPYMEQIEIEEARGLAEEMVDRHLVSVMPSCGVQSVESFQNAYDNLANELQRQAAILHKYAQEIESSGSHPALSNMIHSVLGQQTSHNLTSTSLCMREALIQAQVAYVACRLRTMHEQELSLCKQTSQNMEDLVKQHALNVSAIQEKYEASLKQERENFTQTMISLEKENQTLKSEISERVNQLSQQQEKVALLEEHFQKETQELKLRYKHELSQAEQSHASTELALMETAADGQRKLELLLVDIDGMEESHKSHIQKLQQQFEERICELQQIHKEEVDKLHSQCLERLQCATERPGAFYPLPCVEVSMEEDKQRKGVNPQNTSEVDSMVVLKDRIQELETQMNSMKDELENKHLEGDVASLREKYQRDFESLKATCERGFAAMEETHQKVIDDIQRQHQREISKLMEERERLLAEETAATIAAIEAMKNAHKEELEKTQRSQLSGLNSDIDELRLQYEEELQSIQRELEVLSEQYSQKCLENAHLTQALEAERQALRQCQRENQELNAHNQELNNRLTAEITRMRSCFSGETALSPLTHGKDVYELEVLLRIKESEIQYLKQEIHSLKDELQSAFRDKKYATDKYKDIYTELSIVKAKADCDISKLKEKLLLATEALGERTVDDSVTSGYDIMKSKSNPDFMKKEKSSTSRQSRAVRSKVSVTW